MRNILFLSLFMVFAMSSYAFAFSTPSDGDLWYDFYDTFYNKILHGPLGFVAVSCLLVFCLYSGIRGGLATGVITILACAGLYNLENVVVTMGYTV